VINEACTASCILHNLLSIRRETRRCVCARRALADVIRCRRGDDDFCALGDEALGRIGEIRNVGLDDDASGSGACLGAGAEAGGSPVVGCGERTAVVVSELDDHVVAGDDFVDKCCEATFVGVGACGAATDGGIDDVGVLDREWEIDTPAWLNVKLSFVWTPKKRSFLPFVPEPPPPTAIVESPAM